MQHKTPQYLKKTCFYCEAVGSSVKPFVSRFNFILLEEKVAPIGFH